MTREPLPHASEALRKASAASENEEVRERFYDHSNDLAMLATGESEPDPAELDRVEDSLGDLAAQSSGDIRAHVEEAINYVQEYRESGEYREHGE